MITYVNTVLVGKGQRDIIPDIDTATALKYNADNIGKIIVVDAEKGTAITADSKKMKIGMVTTNAYTNKDCKFHIIKWTNPIQKDAIKSYSNGKYEADTQEKIVIDFTSSSHITELAKGNKRVVLRLTFKDLPTRYRKWSESYEYVTKKGETDVTLAEAMKKQILNNHKRARVEAEAAEGKLTLTAMPYDDDDMIDSISWDNTVRFSANVWYTDPQAPGFASKNKYGLGAQITKTPGKKYQASAKIVRYREAMGMGYMGILNRGEGTWPIIKPDMNVTLDGKYDYIILEWENMYRTADDLQRRTKECVEIYELTDDNKINAAKTAIELFINGAATHSIPVQTVINDNND